MQLVYIYIFNNKHKSLDLKDKYPLIIIQK